MDLIYSFDSKRFCLGTLCKQGHRWPGTELSLRRAVQDSTARRDPRRPDGMRVMGCMGCLGRKKSDWLISFIDTQAMGLPDGWSFGKLCQGEHKWNGHEMSLRDKHGKCPECEKQRKRSEYMQEYHRTWCANNKDKIRQRNQIAYAARRTDPEAWAQFLEKRKEAKRELNRQKAIQGLTSRGEPVKNQLMQASLLEDQETRELLIAIRNAGRCPSVARLVMREQRRYWRENPDAKKEHDRQWAQARWWLEYQTNPELRLYTRQKSKRRKAQMRGSVAQQLSGAQVLTRFQQFGHRCAYCGATGDLHIEHVVPISCGGPHSLGNIVPACESCNYSKHDHEAESWYRAQPFFSETRWRKICRVLDWNRSCVGQLALL